MLTFEILYIFEYLTGLAVAVGDVVHVHAKGLSNAAQWGRSIHVIPQ